jgi:hypothetical protein
VGKSYGKLNKQDRAKYDNMNCDEVLSSKNPSCDDVRFDSFAGYSAEEGFVVYRLGATIY